MAILFRSYCGDRLVTADSLRAGCCLLERLEDRVLLSAAGLTAQVSEALIPVLVGCLDGSGEFDQQIIIDLGGTIEYDYHLIDAVAAIIPASALKKLKSNVELIVETDIAICAADIELDNSWGVVRIGADVAHAAGSTGEGIKVAVIDSGIDYTHPDLDDNYAGGYDFLNDDADPMDDNGHGTHVAGIIAAEDNGFGVVGVAPDVSLYALKVLGPDGTGYFSDVIAAVEWAVDNGIHITNNSYSSPDYPGSLVEAAFVNAAAAGVLHIAAAGNSGNYEGIGDNVEYPARWDSVVAVASTLSNDAVASSSSTGPDVELAAPGVEVYSTLPGGEYDFMSGTSMASPHVAGTAALIMAEGVIDINGSGTINDEVRLTLQQTAEIMEWPATWIGFGLVDVDAALASPELTGAAYDGFESGDFAGGAGWISGWSVTGDATIQSKGSPISGVFHLRFRGGDGYVARAADLSGLTNVQLSFYAMATGWEGADQVEVLVSSDGANWTAVRTFTAADSDDWYHYYKFDLTGFEMSGEFYVAFDAGMNEKRDTWYVDDVRLVDLGQPPAPPLPGDLNGNGVVDGEDLNIILSAWNQAVTPGDWLAGDPSGDGWVLGEDLNAVLSHWNTSIGGQAAAGQDSSLAGEDSIRIAPAGDAAARSGKLLAASLLVRPAAYREAGRFSRLSHRFDWLDDEVKESAADIFAQLPLPPVYLP